MLNINHNKNNKIVIEYNTKNGVKTVLKKVRPLKVIKTDNKSDFKDLKGNNYSLNAKTGEYLYTALYNKKYKSFNYYLNTVLRLPEDFINKLKSPKFVFYDIETNGKGTPKKDNKTGKWTLNNKARINSIAWIDYQTKEEYCLIRNIDGSEKTIIKKFIKYCTDNKIMGLVGHNNFEFDNIFMIERLKTYGLHNELKLFYNDCNIDTMVLASLFKYTDDNYISLQDLAVNKLYFKEGKIDTGVYNPVTLYNKAITELKENNNKDLLNKFKEYNIQDVKLTMAVFDGMNCNEQLNNLFKQTLCPFNKMQYNSILLNFYTCKEAFKDNIVIPENLNTQIEFENNGGYNYIEESETLNIYNDVIDFDIVSYYPNLLMLIGADNTYGYDNVDRETGEIKPFKNIPNGFLAEITKDLYESRLKTKELRNNQLKGSDEYKRFDYEQLTKKIIVNSLYGLLSQKNGNYVLRNDLIGSTITAIGRDVLKNVIEKFKGVYGKTDSVFISRNGKNEKKLLKEVNNYVTTFLKENYNLNNVRNGKQIILFEIDEIIDKLIVKDKNNYVKVVKGELRFKGSSFKNNEHSEYEKNLIKIILNSIAETDDNKQVINTVEEYTEKKLKTCKNLQFYSKYIKLSKKQSKQSRMLGRFYMNNNNLQYLFDFKYLSCRVNGDKYDYIMYPKGHKPKDLTVNKLYVYKMMIDTLNNCKIIDKGSKKDLEKKYNIKKLNEKNKQIKDKYINKNNVSSDNYNESAIIDKKGNSSYSKLYRKIGDKIKELTIMKIQKNSKKPLGKWSKITKTNINELKDYNENIAIVFNPESRYKYGFIDIDGFKEDLGEKDNRKFKEDLLNLLKDNEELYNHSVVQKTQSGGYHFIFKHNETDIINNKYINGFKLPTELQEKYNLQNHDKLGAGGNSGAIEIFVNEKKYCLVYPTKIKHNKHYEIIHVGRNFGKPLKNIKKQLKKVFGENKETTKKYKSKKKVKKEINIKNNTKLKKKFLDDTELKKLFIEEHKIRTGNHNDSIREFTAILKNMGLTDGEAVKYMDDVLTGANDNTTEHTAQVQCYLSGNDGTKPNFKEYLNSKELINKLDTYLNTIIYPTKKKLKNKANRNNKKSKNKTKNKHNRNDTNLYEELKGSFADYIGEIPYILNEEFISYLNSQIDILKEKIQNKPIKTLDNGKTIYNICDFIHGGLYHYGFTREDRYKIIKNGTLPIQVVEENEYVYGFPYLIKWIESNINGDDISKLLTAIEKIINYIKLNPSMNPIFYDDGEENGYIQMKNQLIKQSKRQGNKKILNCTFKQIIKQVQLGNKTGIEKETKYIFVLTLYKNNRNVILKNKTIQELYDYIEKKNLFLETLSTLKTDLIRFINFADNKGDIEEKETAYIEGFVIDGDDENYKIIPYFPDLKMSKYTIEEAINELNSIYNDVYECNTNFIKVINWFLIHSLREIWLHYGIEDSILSNLVQYGTEGTGKTNSIATAFAFFISNKNKFKQIGNEADTKASINRAYGNSTLPLVIDEPDFKITEIYPLAKKSTFTRIGSTKAKDQFGSDNREFPVTRQMTINQNEPPEAKEGANRRFSIIEHTEDNKLSNEQKEKLRKHWIGAGNKTPVLKLNKIGKEFIKFVTTNTEWINKNINEIANTKGFHFLEVFYKYLNDNSTVKLNEDFYNIKLYTFDKLEINYKLKFIDRFTYNFTKGVTGINLTEYQPEKIEEMLKNTTYINIIKKDGKEQILIEWEGLNNFIRSKAGLETGYTQKGFLKLLGIKNKKFKQQRIEKNGNKDNRERGLILTIKEFYKYFFNKEIEEY